jgi:hypothetical protein
MWLAHASWHRCTQPDPYFRYRRAQTKRTAGGFRVLVLWFVCFIPPEGMCCIIFGVLKINADALELDEFLHYRIFRLQKQGAILSSRWLEDTLCTLDWTPYNWDFWENTQGTYLYLSHSSTPTVSLFSQTRKSSFGSVNLVSRSFGCYQRILESGPSSTSDGESLYRCSITPTLFGNSPQYVLGGFFLRTIHQPNPSSGFPDFDLWKSAIVRLS